MGDDAAISGPPYWGVDSVKPANQPAQAKGFRGAYYDWIVQIANGRKPAFFGRYLTADSNKYQKITPEEIEFLGARNCRMLLNYNQLSSAVVRGNRVSGDGHARMAADAARKIGAPTCHPPIIWLYANIDSEYQPSVDWLVGWLEGLMSRGYGPGLYFPAGGSKTCGNAIMACKNIPEPDYWISIWSWSQMSKQTKNTAKTDFSPVQPVGCGDVVDVLQYGGNCFAGEGVGVKFDMNMANERGYDRMWTLRDVWTVEDYTTKAVPA